MPRRALAQKRPYLLAAIVAALAFYYLRAGSLPELWLVPLKGAAAGFLAAYCLRRHSGDDARAMGWALGAAAAGDMGLEFDRAVGALLWLLAHAMATSVFVRHRRAPLEKADSWIVGPTLIMVPLAGWLLPHERGQAFEVLVYTAALGAMAASAWASTFPRLKTGAGAMLVAASHLLLVAETGPLGGSEWPAILAWPIQFLGLFLIATGVIQTLAKRDPDLRVVRAR